MTNKSMGQIICTHRKEKGMTQKELADQLNITDKAVSKWERDLACPDTQTLPRLAGILGITLDELLSGESPQPSGHRGAEYLMGIILPAIPLAMGIAVTITAILGKLDVRSGLSMLGLGLACAGLHLLKEKS